ncbi:MAG: glycerophosphodiester phosphodiesterase family protein [Vicinamibacterales bacterium]
MSFFEPGRLLVFAHRGGRDLGPENTLAAFDLGLAAGADGLEIDVHLSADGVPVVCHDATLTRTTDVEAPIAALTAAALHRVDAGYWFAQDGIHPFRGRGIGVPTLAETLARYPGARIIIELKRDDRAIGEAVARDVVAAAAQDRVCIAGAGRVGIAAAVAALPGVASSASAPEVRMALYRSRLGWPVSRVPYGGYQVPEYAGSTRVVTPRFIRHAHRAGLLVQVWTVNEEVDMRRLLAWGADALITDRPALARAVVDAVGGRR